MLRCEHQRLAILNVDHGQLGKADIDPVQIADDVTQEQQRHEPPHDLFECRIGECRLCTPTCCSAALRIVIADSFLLLWSARDIDAL